MVPTEKTPSCAFLSFNRRDFAAVKALARWLEKEGLEIYLDESKLDRGRLVQPGLIKALRSCHCYVAFLGRHGLGPWQALEAQVAIKRLVDGRQMLRGAVEPFRIVKVLLPGYRRPKDELASLGFLALYPDVQFRSIDDECAFRHLAHAITGHDAGQSSSSQYSGGRPPSFF